jgi:C_GCAxxG_C_C family probable redox protein
MMNFFKKRRAEGLQAGQVDQVVAQFDEGLNCAQALLITYGPQLGLDRENALKIAAAFGSGMGRGETCGAVTGAIMVIGLKHARIKAMDYFSKEEIYDFAAEFITRFRERNETIVCRELLGCDVTTTEGLKVARKDRKFKKQCPKYVRDAAEILEEMLKER